MSNLSAIYARESLITNIPVPALSVRRPWLQLEEAHGSQTLERYKRALYFIFVVVITCTHYITFLSWFFSHLPERHI